MVLVKAAFAWYFLCLLSNLVVAQRSLLHWKRDLENRLKLYETRRNEINQIIASSIVSQRRLPPSIADSGQRPTFVASNVHFTDLIVSDGSLRFEQQVAQQTVNVMLNKTAGYIGSKMSEVYEITSNLGNIRRNIVESRARFIYKGSPRLSNQPAPLYYNTTRISGLRVFSQVGHIHAVNSQRVEVSRINATDVNQVLAETYMENPSLSLEDPQGRLYFEGTKTFWNTTFLGQLRSGCCDRMRPLHTSRMMLRSKIQEVSAPILVRSASQPGPNRDPVVIRRLMSARLTSRRMLATPRPGSLLVSPISSSIMTHDVIKLNESINHPEIQKTIVFAGGVSVDSATLQTYGNKLTIYINGPNAPNGTAFTLNHDNYLLRHPSSSADYQQIAARGAQHIMGSVVFDGEVTFGSSVNPLESVNSVANFGSFLANDIVRIDRAGLIRGPVRFGATIGGYNYPSGAKVMQPSNEIIRVAQRLNVSLVNGMRWPQDLLVLPLNPLQVVHVSGRRLLSGNIVFNSHLTVRGRVAGMRIPEDVIPLHLDDRYDFGPNETALFFSDGIDTDHLSVLSGQFDDINLSDVHGNEQDLILRSMLATLPDGTHIIRAPLHVQNLHLIGSRANEGLLNGIRPQDIIELKIRDPTSPHHRESIINGRKTFLNEVEVTDCRFDNINDLYNWTHQLIRIDRPIAQTVSSRVAFVQPPSSALQYDSPVVRVNKMRVDYELENGNQASYARNWNFSPELYIINQALARNAANYTKDRYRVVQQVKLLPHVVQQRVGRVNGLELGDIIRLDEPFKFIDRYVLVGKVDVRGTIQADRIRSTYPLDNMDLNQFANYRVPLWSTSPSLAGGLTPIRLSSVVLAGENRASYLQSQLVNGLVFNEFVNSTMSLTRPQVVDRRLVFKAPTNFEAMVKTHSSFNGIKHFKDFAGRLQQARYTFEDGLQCNAVVLSATS